MFLDRTDRSKVSLWWWTVDHKLMGLVILLIIGGIMVLMSAGSPVAIKKGLAEYHFLEKQITFLCVSIPLMIIISIQEISTIKRFCFLLLIFSFLCLVYLNFFGIDKVDIISADQMALDYDKSIRDAENQIENLFINNS